MVQAEEWLYFVQGNARATAFIGGAAARTFDFTAGDTAVFPDNAGHYVENRSKNETLGRLKILRLLRTKFFLVWIELYRSDRVVDISLTQWLALTPVHVVVSVLKIPESVVRNLKKEKQLILA